MAAKIEHFKQKSLISAVCLVSMSSSPSSSGGAIPPGDVVVDSGGKCGGGRLSMEEKCKAWALMRCSDEGLSIDGPVPPLFLPFVLHGFLQYLPPTQNPVRPQGRLGLI